MKESQAQTSQEAAEMCTRLAAEAIAEEEAQAQREMADASQDGKPELNEESALHSPVSSDVKVEAKEPEPASVDSSEAWRDGRHGEDNASEDDGEASAAKTALESAAESVCEIAAGGQEDNASQDVGEASAAKVALESAMEAGSEVAAGQQVEDNASEDDCKTSAAKAALESAVEAVGEFTASATMRALSTIAEQGDQQAALEAATEAVVMAALSASRKSAADQDTGRAEDQTELDIWELLETASFADLTQELGGGETRDGPLHDLQLEVVDRALRQLESSLASLGLERREVER